MPRSQNKHHVQNSNQSPIESVNCRDDSRIEDKTLLVFSSYSGYSAGEGEAAGGETDRKSATYILKSSIHWLGRAKLTEFVRIEAVTGSVLKFASIATHLASCDTGPNTLSCSVSLQRPLNIEYGQI